MPIVGQVSFNWPFDTTSLVDHESKVAIKFNGGYSAVWDSIDTVTFVDNTGTYNILWVNKQINKFVFLIPKKGYNTGTTLNITNIKNPYPYQKGDYETSNNIEIDFYHNYFQANSKIFSQPAFSIFTRNPSLVDINQNLPSNTIDTYPSSNSIAPNSFNVLKLSVEFTESQANLQTRKLDLIQIKFTSGINDIRECRAMRNDTLPVNAMEVCQPMWDGSNWWVKLHNVSNSDVSHGWWIQAWVQINSGTLAYTSYVKASNNNEIEYQNSYTVSLSAYNSSRTVPSALSWTNQKYVAHFYETQWKFLEAVTGQKTQYIKFRFTQVVTSSTNSDEFWVYLHDDQSQQPFSPVNSFSNVVVQFLPALSGDSDFSIGQYAQATLTTSSSRYMYQIYLRRGGLTGGHDYLMQISEYNTAASSFYMGVSPRRDNIDMRYRYKPSGTYDYWDDFNVYSHRRFREISFLHTTTTVNDYDTLTIKYKPYGGLSAFASNREIIMKLAVEGRYHESDCGAAAIYTADGRTLETGGQYSGVVGNSNGNEAFNIHFAQYSIDNTPIEYTLTRQSAYTDNIEYTWIVLLIKDPSTAWTSLRFNVSMMIAPASSYEYIWNHYESLNEYYTVSDTSSVITTSITNNLRAVQTSSAVDLAVNLVSVNLEQWDTAIFKIDNSQAGLLQSIASPNDTTNYDYHYFKHINMIMAQKKSTNSITNIGIGASSSALNYQTTFGLSWVKVFNSSNAFTAYNPYTLHTSTPASLTLTTLTNYASNTITLTEGYTNQGSTAMQQLTFATPIVPDGG